MWQGSIKKEVESITYNGQEITSESKIVTKNDKNQYEKVEKDKSAINYYIEALEFSRYIDSINLNEAINVVKKVYINDELIYDGTNNRIAKPNDVFDLSKDPENNQSNFVNHKREIIKLNIENNLQIAFNNYVGGSSTYNYQLPKLTEEDWNKVYKNVSIISFMQGLQVGSKIFNDYAVVTSTGNEEYIDPENIYFIDTNTYHRLGCDDLTKDIHIGYKSCTYLKQNKIIDSSGKDILDINGDGKIDDNKSGYILKDIGKIELTACYKCIIESKGSTLYKDDGALLGGNWNNDEKKSYYTALARERYNLMKLKPTRILNSSLYR